MERLTDEMLKEIAEYFDFDVKVRGGESEAVKRGRILLAEIERLKARERELVEGLKPFANGAYHESIPDDQPTIDPGVTVGDKRRAKALLEKE